MKSITVIIGIFLVYYFQKNNIHEYNDVMMQSKSRQSNYLRKISNNINSGHTSSDVMKSIENNDLHEDHDNHDENIGVNINLNPLSESEIIKSGKFHFILLFAHS